VRVDGRGHWGRTRLGSDRLCGLERLEEEREVEEVLTLWEGGVGLFAGGRRRRKGYGSEQRQREMGAAGDTLFEMDI